MVNEGPRREAAITSLANQAIFGMALDAEDSMLVREIIKWLFEEGHLHFHD